MNKLKWNQIDEWAEEFAPADKVAFADMIDDSGMVYPAVALRSVDGEPIAASPLDSVDLLQLGEWCFGKLRDYPRLTDEKSAEAFDRLLLNSVLPAIGYDMRDYMEAMVNRGVEKQMKAYREDLKADVALEFANVSAQARAAAAEIERERHRDNVRKLAKAAASDDARERAETLEDLELWIEFTLRK